MNPRIKRLLSMLLALTMMFSLTTPVSAYAARNNMVEIEVGETNKLKVSDSYVKTTWMSSDTDIATVSSDGTVTGVAPGIATITATNKSYFGFLVGSKTTKFTVIVAEPHETLTVKAGETIQLELQTSGDTVTWQSSDEMVATVDGNGMLAAVNEGNVTITATVQKTIDGNKWLFWRGSGKTITTVAEFEVEVMLPPVGYPLTWCREVENSNNPNAKKTKDVSVGTWTDCFGEKHPDAIKFWVNKSMVDTEYIIYDVNYDYSKLVLSIVNANDNAWSGENKITVYVEDVVIYRSDWITNGMPVVETVLDITNVDQIKIECSTNTAEHCYCLVSGLLYK